MGRLLDVLRGSENDSGEIIYECRNCGETVSADTDDCPACGSTEIASYRL